MDILVSVLVCLGLGMICVIVRTWLDASLASHTHHAEQTKATLQADHDQAMGRLEDLKARKEHLERELVLLRQAAIEGLAPKGETPAMDPMEWLLVQGHITLEQLDKAKVVHQTMGDSHDLPTVCMVLGFIDRERLKEAKKVAKRGA